MSRATLVSAVAVPLLALTIMMSASSSPTAVTPSTGSAAAQPWNVAIQARAAGAPARRISPQHVAATPFGGPLVRRGASG